MPSGANRHRPRSINSLPAWRTGDQWRELVELAEAWSKSSGDRTKVEATLAEMTATEEFHAYPGLQLLAALRDHVAAGDAHATASLARRITRALLTRSFRQTPAIGRHTKATGRRHRMCCRQPLGAWMRVDLISRS